MVWPPTLPVRLIDQLTDSVKQNKPTWKVLGEKSKTYRETQRKARLGNLIGLDEEDRRRVFDRFFKASPASEGSGVGLSIARVIADDLGIGIRILSPGKERGTAVELSFPLQEAAHAR